MERLKAPLFDIVPILLKSATPKSSNGAAAVNISLGETCMALFSCIRTMHERGFLYQDVKPENFMLSYDEESTTPPSQRIRLIDFGLAESFHDMSSQSHRNDLYPSAALVGTPTYASLNVMDGHTPARRDDLESLGYLICELILLFLFGKKQVLPWANARSDKELYQIKKQQMDASKRSESTLFAELAGLGVDKLMSAYFAKVMSLEYKEKPDYDSLTELLGNVVVAKGKVVATTMCVSGGGGGGKDSAPRGGAKKAAASVAADENVENCKKGGSVVASHVA